MNSEGFREGEELGPEQRRRGSLTVQRRVCDSLEWELASSVNRTFPPGKKCRGRVRRLGRATQPP